MSDKYQRVNESYTAYSGSPPQDAGPLFKRLRDMGDSTFAEVVSANLTPRLTANFSRPADATQYSISDHIANSGTGSSVVPITFTAAGIGASARYSGKITGCRCVVTPASGNLVITALDFELILFRPESGVPFAAGSYPADNAALAITAAAFRERVCSFRFSSGAWTNPAGTLVAGVTGYQSVAINSSRPYAPFNCVDLAALPIGVVQALAVWNPGAVVNRFDFALDVDLD